MPSCHFVSVVPRSSLVGFMASGCDSEAIRMDCLRVALNLQSIHNSQDCKEPGNPVSGIAGHREDCRRSTGPGLRSAASNRNPGQQSEWHDSDTIGAQSVPIPSGLPKIQNPVAIVQIANIEVSIAGGLRKSERALFGDCGAPRGLRRLPEHASGPALQSGLRPDGQPLG